MISLFGIYLVLNFSGLSCCCDIKCDDQLLSLHTAFQTQILVKSSPTSIIIILYTYLPLSNLWFINNYYGKHLQLYSGKGYTVRIITFLKPEEYSQPLLNELEILKLTDLITPYSHSSCISTTNFNLLPSSFEYFFQTAAFIHSHNTSLPSKPNY